MSGLGGVLERPALQADPAGAPGRPRARGERRMEILRTRPYVVSDVNFDLPPGEFLTLLGPADRARPPR
ncbi:MAG: hypothetical protein WDN49_21205 [Acetobacteraceae bacterium]